MDEDIDAIIGDAVRRATHPGLAGIGNAVLGRIATDRLKRSRNWRLDAIAMAFSLAMGFGGAVTLVAPVTARSNALFDGVARLAPSTLLESGR